MMIIIKGKKKEKGGSLNDFFLIEQKLSFYY